MRREVIQIEHLVASLGVSIKGSKAGSGGLDAHALVQRASLAPKFAPQHELGVADVFLRLGDGAATDSIHDQFAPELI